MASPSRAHADDIDTEHLFGFMIGSDVGSLGEREFQSQTTARLSRDGGRYRALQQRFELEFVPAQNFRVEVGSSFAAHDIAGVPGLEDRTQLTWQGASIELRKRLLERDDRAVRIHRGVRGQGRPDRGDVGIAGAALRHRMDAGVRSRIAAEPAACRAQSVLRAEWTRPLGASATERESTAGVAWALMGRVTPSVLLGGEARYLRKYDGIGLTELAGQALFVGPTAHVTLSERAWLTAAWSVQAFGRPAGSSAGLDAVHFDRHQVRLIYGVSF